MKPYFKIENEIVSLKKSFDFDNFDNTIDNFLGVLYEQTTKDIIGKKMEELNFHSTDFCKFTETGESYTIDVKKRKTGRHLGTCYIFKIGNKSFLSVRERSNVYEG